MTDIDDLVRARVAAQLADAKKRRAANRWDRADRERRRAYGLATRTRQRQQRIDERKSA